MTNTANGCLSVAEIEVPLISGSNQPIDIEHWNIAPNPADQEIVIALELQNMQAIRASLLGISEKTIATKASSSSKTHQFVFDTQNLPEGIYLVSIQTETGFLTRKIVVAH